MMDDIAITKTAIDLLHMPSRARVLRSSPLPRGAINLLRIVAGDEDVITQASDATGRSRDTVREAAAFFIEQVLLFPEADSYRVLGTAPGASSGELRRNMGLLLRWLHPDQDHQGLRSVFAGRVTRAWNDLKSEERRAGYDRAQRLAQLEKSLVQKKGNGRERQRLVREGHFGATYLPHRRIGAVPVRHKPIGLLRRVFLFLRWQVGR
jgi:hypothetical protein